LLNILLTKFIVVATDIHQANRNRVAADYSGRHREKRVKLSGLVISCPENHCPLCSGKDNWNTPRLNKGILTEGFLTTSLVCYFYLFLYYSLTGSPKVINITSYQTTTRQAFLPTLRPEGCAGRGVGGKARFAVAMEIQALKTSYLV